MKKYLLSGLLACVLLMPAFAQQKSKAKPKRPTIDLTKYVLVKGGEFMMGTNQAIEIVETPEHKVQVGNFYIAKTEVTFDDIDKFTEATKRDTIPSMGWGRGKRPACMVSWLDAVAYCNWLSEKEELSKCYLIEDEKVTYLDTAKGYRLPTEAEWEYAARGGSEGKGFMYSGGKEISEVGWYKGNSGDKTMPVAQKSPNELGIYDMTGNLWEWVWDYFDGSYYKKSPEIDPRGPENGSYRVMRGGAWYNDPNYARVVTRQNHHPGFKQNSVGFRVARNYFE